MNLYAWIDENGSWRVSHFPPNDGSSVLMIALAECYVGAMFLDLDTAEEIEVETTQ